MDTLFLYNTKTLKEKFTTKVFAGDNHITKINVQIPDNIGGYPKRECEYNLRAIIPEGNLSYMIEPSQPYFYITNDITEKAQTVKLMMIITHEGNVIGRTNTVDLIVNEPAEAPDPPLTPREEFDEVIAEQRAEIAEQAETISTQGETITQQTEQITELSGEVTELETENTRLETQHTADQNTIQYLINNPPETRLQAKSVTPTTQMQVVEPDTGYGGLSTVTVGSVAPQILESKEITPSPQTQYYAPSEGKDGFSSVTVDGATVEALGLNENYYKLGEPFLDKVGKYNPFPENSYGGIYFTELNEDDFPVGIKIVNYDGGSNYLTANSFYGFNFNTLRGNLKTFEMLNCRNFLFSYQLFMGFVELSKVKLDGVKLLEGNAFINCSSLKEIELSASLVSIGAGTFSGCISLEKINLPNSLTSLVANIFNGCVSLKNVTIENGFNCNNLSLSASTLYSVETIVSWLEALADRTGETAYTLTIGTTNLNKMTAEEKAIATNKNWNLA